MFFTWKLRKLGRSLNAFGTKLNLSPSYSKFGSSTSKGKETLRGVGRKTRNSLIKVKMPFLEDYNGECYLIYINSDKLV